MSLHVKSNNIRKLSGIELSQRQIFKEIKGILCKTNYWNDFGSFP